MEKKKIAVLVGSLRKESYNRKLAVEAMRMASDKFDMELIEIGQLTFYNQDLDANPPIEWVEFREKIRKTDGFLFFTPEYNRSIPAALKNAIDIASRPYGENYWNGKPGAIVSSSISTLGAVAANHALRQPMIFLNAFVMQQPEAYIANAGSLFDSEGNFNKEDTRQFLQEWVKAFESWIERF